MNHEHSHTYMRTLSLILGTATSLLAQQSPQASPHALAARLIAAPEAKSAATLMSPVAVRELPDGRTLVNDTRRRQLLLFDRGLTAMTIVADSAGGRANSYGASPGGIIPFLVRKTPRHSATTRRHRPASTPKAGSSTAASVE
jgi:hypothetical protein